MDRNLPEPQIYGRIIPTWYDLAGDALKSGRSHLPGRITVAAGEYQTIALTIQAPAAARTKGGKKVDLPTRIERCSFQGK